MVKRRRWCRSEEGFPHGTLSMYVPSLIIKQKSQGYAFGSARAYSAMMSRFRVYLMKFVHSEYLFKE